MDNTRGKPMDFDALQSKAASMGETDDCSVKAWAVVTGDDYDTSHYIVEDLAKRPRRGGPQWRAYLEAFRAMGYRLTLVEYASKTVVTLGREFATRRDAQYLVATGGGGHVFGIRDGRVVDWTEGRRHRIAAVWRVEYVGVDAAGFEVPEQWKYWNQFRGM
jgi:hypothetical protein